MTADPARLRRDADWIQRLGDKGHLDFESTEPVAAALRAYAAVAEAMTPEVMEQARVGDWYAIDIALDALAAALGYDDARP